MASEWFCQIAGAELGPLSGQQVKTMAAQGRLHPDDVLRRGADGPWLPAGRVKGLFPADQPAAETPTAPAAEAPAESKPPAKKIAKSLPVAKQSAAAKPAVKNGAKPAAAASRAAKPATAPKKTAGSSPAKNEPDSPADSQGPAEAEFPAELAGGIPRPKGKKGMNFDHLAIDTTTPLKITGARAAAPAA